MINQSARDAEKTSRAAAGSGYTLFNIHDRKMDLISGSPNYDTSTDTPGRSTF